MARPLFNEIVTAVIDHDPFFRNNFDCTGKEGISGLLKCTSAIRQLAYGVHAEFLDEYMQISERISHLALDHFCESVMQIYGPEYLRKPTVTDVEKLYLHHEEKHGFPRILGSLDFNTSSTDSQMHNNIMAAGSKDRPPILGPGRYSQWRSRFLRYIDTKPNGAGLSKCILSGPYVPSSVLIQAVAAAEANEMWIAIERLQQGESLNVQDVKTNLFWEFGKFTSRDGESMESYYSRQSANPLALFAAAQPYLDNYYQAPKPQRTTATSSSTRPSASTRHKGKEITKLVTPQSESVSEEDSDPEQAQRDKDMQKNLALLAKYFKRLYKPTNNNLRTSSNSRNKTEDTTPRYNNNNQSGQFENQRTMTVVGARETVGSQVVQQTGIQCFNCKGYEHYAKECRKPKLEVSAEESSSIDQPLEQVQNHDENNAFANVRRHSEQPESINDTYVLETDDSNVTPDSSNICTNDNQIDQNASECVDERAALANLIANLTLDTEENKTILKQLKKANASLTQELKECRTNLDETGRALGEATSCRDSCLIALQNKQNEFEKYKAFNDRTIDYEILQTKLNETLGLLALKDIEIKEGLKTKAYEISVLNQKHDELVKKSLLTKSQLEGYLKENTKVISDLKVKEDKDIDKMIEMDKQLKFLNEIVYTRNQSIQTIHMLAPKCATYNGRLTFANPRYLKKAQSEKPCLYEIPFDTSDPANRFAPEREETMTLDNESRSKLNKDIVKPYDYTKQNSLYEIFKAPSLEYLYQLERTKEVRKTMWRKPFVRTRPNIAKNIAFLPVSKSISKSRQVFNDMTFNINQFREIVDQTWLKHTSSCFRVPTAHDMELLIKTLLMPLSIKSQNDSFRFEHELKTEMHEDFEYVKSLEKEIDELESEKADFSNIYDLLLEECVSKDVICSYLNSLSKLNAHAELQCMYLHKVKECKCLALKLSKQTESVNKEVHNTLLKICKENGSNVFRKEREQYHEIHDLKAQMQDKNIAINKLKKLVEKCKGKSVETQFDETDIQKESQKRPNQARDGKDKGGTFLDKRPLIAHHLESKSKVCHSRSKAIVAKVSTSASTSGVSPDVAELKDMVRALLLDRQTSPVPAPAPVKAIEQSCVTCGGAHSYRNSLANR
ncbi:hypothetical protein Tco_0908437 [Tanacetum coccineum]|uniref:CCHC-type domain-containing protein n=1 Tax=Tanacetum coccineum TaxID=301880 RepID=A0ABQ5CP89_9ASTR